ncbi:MAG TPA: glucosidase, partial [Dongiaceae bacterium]|nr:glucosidase [Dongiaceae bacterium]
MLYKYPQAEFPYQRLLQENRQRGLADNEYELIDTGIFDEDRYWDVFVEYAKAAADDILVRITVHNRGPESAVLHLLPQLWFRNTWSWDSNRETKPRISLDTGGVLLAEHKTLGDYWLYGDGDALKLFCDNETNVQRIYGEAAQGHFKDAFHEYVVKQNHAAVNALQQGTKAAMLFVQEVQAGQSTQFRLRLCAKPNPAPFANFEEVTAAKLREADEFYAKLQCGLSDPDARLVQRQAFAGLIWSKQRYAYNVQLWLDGDDLYPSPPAERLTGRNHEWTHLEADTIFCMPDKWEYPWFASWDCGFHAVALGLIDPEFAKQQLIQIGHVWYLHPNGQLPAYEWNFSDTNPPVHAWAAWRVFQIDRKRKRAEEPGYPGDLMFLERMFQKLLLNFTWWVNRKDADGRNLFQGGFLGLDNIGAFDRDETLPSGGYLSQSDGTSWMAMYCLNMMRIAIELAQHNHAYEDMATKFFEHFLYIAKAMTDMGGKGMGLWNEEDSFYYDVLNLPDGEMVPLKIRSMVGLMPLFAVETLEPECLANLPVFKRRMEWFLQNRPEMANLVSRWTVPGVGERRLLSLLRGHRMKALLKRMLDPAEFLSDHGVRSLSRYHAAQPFEHWTPLLGKLLSVGYEPSESRSRLFGGNSNWRGPVWFPVNFLIIESLQKFHYYYGDDFKVECPTGSGRFVTIDQVAEELTCRLARIFLKNEAGVRQVNALYPKMQEDPNFRDYIPFYEFFDGDIGRGVGASHQTGWTAIIAKLLQPRPGYHIG